MHIGIIGLGTMGANIARNCLRHRIRVSVFNRTEEKLTAFVKAYAGEGMLSGFSSYKKFIQSLSYPRVILLMVNAGDAVSEVLKEITPLLSKGDIVIDGGNSHYRDTERRWVALREKGMFFIGMGISGGADGALNGPSLMPGGDETAYRTVEPLLRKIAARDGSGGVCVSFMGPAGAGHFVKMVHNGIEYGVMQLIAEAYALLKADRWSDGEIARIIHSWTTVDLKSYLMEVTYRVVSKKVPPKGAFLLSLIKDCARQKGTGKWTLQAAADYGVAVPVIAAAVDARFLSADGEMRERNARSLPEALVSVHAERKKFLKDLRAALEAATVLTYAQGFNLIAKASSEEGWDLPLSEIARIWRGGCIIRSPFLALCQATFQGKEVDQKRAKLAVLRRWAGWRQRAWRKVSMAATARGVPAAAFAASIAYYDTVRSKHLPQNLISGMRDVFGAHGFERTDKEGLFHEKW